MQYPLISFVLSVAISLYSGGSWAAQAVPQSSNTHTSITGKTLIRAPLFVGRNQNRFFRENYQTQGDVERTFPKLVQLELENWTDFVKDTWQRIAVSPTIQNAILRIPNSNVLDDSFTGERIIREQDYFELRVVEQFLQNKRVYWDTYNPLTLVLTSFIYAGEKQSFPFIIGPTMFKNIDQIEDKDSVRYKNTRVAGPIPYRGDDVAIFVGLYRVKIQDWAQQSLNFLELVASAFNSSRMSEYIQIARPLLQGIAEFIGIGDDIQNRLAIRNTFTDPSTGTTNPFSSGYYVVLLMDQSEAEDSEFWVKGNNLYHGADASHLIIYKETDYVLFLIAAVSERGDYTTFEFHEIWDNVVEAIWKSEEEIAKKKVIRLFELVATSPDLTRRDRNRLQVWYKNRYMEEMALYRTIFESLEKAEAALDVPVNAEMVFEEIVEGRKITEVEVEDAIATGELAKYKFKVLDPAVTFRDMVAAF